jgi:hypothetical protein
MIYNFHKVREQAAVVHYKLLSHPDIEPGTCQIHA